jgi:methyl coenzyme M reductase alpha subunit
MIDGRNANARVRFGVFAWISRAPTVYRSAPAREAVPVPCQRVAGSSPWLASSMGGGVG